MSSNKRRISKYDVCFFFGGGFHLSPLSRVHEGRFHASLTLVLSIDFTLSIYVCKIRLGRKVLVSSIYQGHDGINAMYE